MGYPVNVATVTVTGSWTTSDGSTAKPTGTVTFTPNARLVDGATAQIIDQAPVVATLVNGAISVVLMATDDPDLSPAGWAYVITENIDGQAPLTYVEQFPAAQSPVDLSTKAPLVPAPGLVGYVALSAVAAPSGVASLDPTGNVPLSQLGNTPAGSVPATAVVIETTYGQGPAVGGGTRYAREDHTHGTPAALTLAGLGGVPTSRQILAGTAMTGGGDLGADRTLNAILIEPSAAALGLVAHTYQPALSGNAFPLNSGVLVAVLIHLPGAAISKLGIALRSAANTPTGVNALGLYRVVSPTSAVLVDQTGDMSAELASGPGWISGTLSGGSQTPAAGAYYIAALTHFTSGAQVVTTSDSGPSFGGVGMPAINSRRPTVYTTGQASLPASFDPSAYTVNSVAYYMTASA